jgi:type VII secretion integral membrane protein EccD
MTASPANGAVSLGEVCRLTICAPKSRIELGVPAHVPLADLMPTFLGHLGPELANSGLEHGGWVLQRIGEPPLNEDLGTSALGLYDGDVLHLRPRDEQLPPAAFDDLVDGVASGVEGRGNMWQAATTRRLLLFVAALVLAAGLFLTTAMGLATYLVLSAGVACVVLLLGTTVAARVSEDLQVAALLAGAATVYAACAGAALPMMGRPMHVLDAVQTAPGMTSAAACATATLALAWAAIGATAGPVVVGPLVAGLLATIGALSSVFFGLTGPGAAAVVLVHALIVGVRSPLLATRLAGLRVPPLPTTQAEFQEDLDPEPSTELLDRTARADRFLTSFHIGLGGLVAGSVGVLLLGSGWAPLTLAGITSALVLVHARDLLVVWQRLPLVLAGAGGLVGLALVLALSSPATQMIVVPALVLAAAGFCHLAGVLPGRKLLPHWGRAGDILQTVLALAVLPIALAVLEVYEKVRAAWS